MKQGAAGTGQWPDGLNLRTGNLHKRNICLREAKMGRLDILFMFLMISCVGLVGALTFTLFVP